MNQITIYYTGFIKGKWQIEAEKGLMLSGSGISKCIGVGDLNCYMCTKKAIDRLKNIYTWKEVSKF